MSVNFVADNGNNYGYRELINDLHVADRPKPILSNDNLYEFYLSLIFKIVNHREIVLSDRPADHYDSNNSSTDKFDSFSEVDQLIQMVKNSRSEFILFTSGTTGQPKRIKHSISSLTRSVKTGSGYQNNVWGLGYHPAHMAGILVFFQAFLNRNTIINLFQKTRQGVFNAIDQFRITNISATPTFYRLLLPVEKQFFGVSKVTLGGEKSGTHLHDSILKIFPNAKINNIYASTEAGSLFVSHGENFKISPEMNEWVRVENGELLIHKLLLGNSDDLILDHKSYYKTGDIIEWIDEANGIFRFHSRKNELINVGGNKVNPAEVEEAILKYPGTKNVWVYGKKNSVLGNVLCCEIAMHQDIISTEPAIRKFLSDILQDFQIPRKISFVDKIELTNTGKLKRV